jgi:hypothetical protein
VRLLVGSVFDGCDSPAAWEVTGQLQRPAIEHHEVPAVGPRASSLVIAQPLRRSVRLLHGSRS